MFPSRPDVAGHQGILLGAHVTGLSCGGLPGCACSCWPALQRRLVSDGCGSQEAGWSRIRAEKDALVWGLAQPSPLCLDAARHDAGPDGMQLPITCLLRDLLCTGLYTARWQMC